MAGFDFSVIQRSLVYLFREGMVFTLTLTAMAAAGGAVLGTLLAMMRLSSNRPLSWIAALYVNLIRPSVPLLLVIFWFYFLVPYLAAWAIGAATKVGQRDGRLVEMYIFVALVYFLICYVLSWQVRRLQDKVSIVR